VVKAGSGSKLPNPFIRHSAVSGTATLDSHPAAMGLLKEKNHDDKKTRRVRAGYLLHVSKGSMLCVVV
jgi:hypothetical protein